MHQRYSYNDLNPPYQFWLKNVMYLIFNFESWKDSLIGSWKDLSLKQKANSVIWWLCFFGAFSIYSSQYAILFLIFWICSRASGYHLVRTIAEFLDHSGLPVGSISNNSRIVLKPGWFAKKIFHPHNDNFHALHHFDPALPNYHLSAAHSLIENKINCYNSVKKNEGYFLGSTAAIKDLVCDI